MSFSLEGKKIAIIGLGYVGLPLAVEFAKKYETIGYDLNNQRIEELLNFFDKTLEISTEQLKTAFGAGTFFVTSELESIKKCSIYIITVPTPIDKNNRPDLTPILKATQMIARVLKRGDLVIYESTVYPGLTEEECIPLLEKISELKFNSEFFVGYSPERINPGDKNHTLTKILKVTSGSTPEVAEQVDCLYKSIITAGTYKASSIKVAEAAKVIENSQRDINIAFVNELAKIFGLMGIDTNEVLDAASTKWNFLMFKPGLVGGHCIGVDPYYLAQKAQEVGYHPEIILAGRRVNDSMGKFVATEVVKLMIRNSLPVAKARVLILGFTFKENCPDTRNTRVIDIYNELISYNFEIDIYDPWANQLEIKHEYGIQIMEKEARLDFDSYSAIILAVAHDCFKELELVKSEKRVLYDIKGMLSIDFVNARL